MIPNLDIPDRHIDTKQIDNGNFILFLGLVFLNAVKMCAVLSRVYPPFGLRAISIESRRALIGWWIFWAKAKSVDSFRCLATALFTRLKWFLHKPKRPRSRLGRKMQKWNWLNIHTAKLRKKGR